MKISIPPRTLTLIALTSGGIVVLDLITKAWAATALVEGPRALTSWFELTYSENPGIALGIPLGGWPVLVLSALLMGGFLTYAFTSLDLKRRSVTMAVSFILGGAVGNFYDRIVYGIVRDFLHFGSWHIFNVADVAVTVGVALLLIALYRPSHAR